MPRKIRELKADLRRGGFNMRPAKGSHTRWVHPKHRELQVTLSGHDGDDARHYQEDQVRKGAQKSRILSGHYSMVIQWSDEDKVFIVLLPEFGDLCRTHGRNYAEAVKNGQEVLEMLIEDYEVEGRSLPRPHVLGRAAA